MKREVIEGYLTSRSNRFIDRALPTCVQTQNTLSCTALGSGKELTRIVGVYARCLRSHTAYLPSIKSDKKPRMRMSLVRIHMGRRRQTEGRLLLGGQVFFLSLTVV